MGKYRAMDIAKYVISKCTEDKKPITNLQLQKILFFIQRDYLKENSCPLFSDDVEAWQFGPVVADVYYAFCGMGSMKILGEYTPSTSIEKNDRCFIDKIVEAKREKYPWDLVRESHKKDGAWDTIFQNGEGNHCIIPIKLIAERG
jgi:uncharacterized phage-associated protein